MSDPSLIAFVLLLLECFRLPTYGISGGSPTALVGSIKLYRFVHWCFFLGLVNNITLARLDEPMVKEKSLQEDFEYGQIFGTGLGGPVSVHWRLLIAGPW